MFGKLSLDAVPYHDPIAMSAVVGSIVAGLVILSLITYYRRWKYLWFEWLISLDHKKIGIMYIILALVILLRGVSDAIMMRAQQAIAMSSPGYLPPDHYSQIFTAHGTIMVLFVAMPFLVGLMNIIVPPQIGARDVAFPYLNSVSFWLTAAGAMLVMVSLGLGEFSKAGWSGYAPLSELEYSPDTGVDYWLWALQIAGIGSVMTSINFIVTILKMRAPGMKLMRMPIFTWNALCTSILILFSFPILTAALAMLTLDRYLDMHFFTNTLGGNTMMYVNLFWIWGHPEVYVVVLPAFGVFSEVTATFSRKPLFGYVSMVWATGSITFLSFSVWLHHFFTMGAGPGVNFFFGIMTMYRGRVKLTSPMLWTIGFISTFAVGGMTGVLLAAPPADFVFHNSLFLIGHFHNVLIPGALFGYFAAYSYWFPKAIGFPLDEKWGKRAFWCWLIGFYFAFIPLYILGFMGMPRRLAYYDNPAWQPYLIIAALGTVIIFLGLLCQIIQLIVSIRQRNATRDLTGDSWEDGRTLEWAIASPPPVYNFAKIPIIYATDAFMDMKEKGTAYQRPDHYEDIHMPKDTAYGLINGMLAFVFGFAMIWHIWWLVIVSALAVVFTIIARASDDDIHYVIPAAEVERIENERYQQLDEAAFNRRGKPATI
jgi:cytochrome o ubiquinol oxidase subunit 1